MWQNLMATILWPVVPRRRGRKPRVALQSLVASLVFHVMNPIGTHPADFAIDAEWP